MAAPEFTDADLAAIRAEVGPDDPASWKIEQAFVRLGSVAAVVEEILTARLTALRDSGPASFTADDYSQSNAENIKAYERAIARAKASQAAADKAAADAAAAARQAAAADRMRRVGGSWR